MPASAWRRMRDTDLPQVNAVAAAAHPDYPEDAEVFAERLRLYPQGCHVLEGATGALDGYVISHPWHDAGPPALNSLLHRLPDAPSIFYIHDIALLPSAHGGGAASDIVVRLAEHARAQGFAAMSLVAVGGSAGFWQKHGFAVVEGTVPAAKLASYGGGARLMTRRLAGG